MNNQYSRYARKDPNPHVRFDDEYRPMKPHEMEFWLILVGFWFGFILFCSAPW